MTRREKILNMFSHPMAKFSCQQITNNIITEEKLTGNSAKYLSGSISSILRKMVLKNVLEYCDFTTNRGGHFYQLKQ